MAMQIYTQDKTSPRGFSWIWFIRLFQIVITLIVLGITAAGVTSFHSIGCNAPSKLSFNLAVAVLALIGILYLLFATGPREIFRILPWFIFGQIALDGLLLVFWLAASSTSSYNCSDLCNACSFAYDEIWFDNLLCTCFVLFKRDTSPAPKGLARSIEPRRTSNSQHYGGSTVGAKIGLDSIMTILFSITLASTIFYFKRTRNTHTTTAPALATTTNRNPEAGVPLGNTTKQDTYYSATPAAAPAHHGGPEMQSQSAPEYPGSVPFGQQPQQAPGYPQHEMQGGHVGPAH